MLILGKRILTPQSVSHTWFWRRNLMWVTLARRGRTTPTEKIINYLHSFNKAWSSLWRSALLPWNIVHSLLSLHDRSTLHLCTFLRWISLAFLVISFSFLNFSSCSLTWPSRRWPRAYFSITTLCEQKCWWYICIAYEDIYLLGDFSSDSITLSPRPFRS